ncbi:hypothetical protein ES703_91751 [subsurface metagenome]
MISNILRVLMTRSIRPFIFKSNCNYNLDLNAKNLGLYFHIPFCKKLDNIFKLEIYWAKKFRYIKKYSGGYKLTDKGAYLFHLIEQAYTRQYIDKTWRMALNNPWPKGIALY